MPLAAPRHNPFHGFIRTASPALLAVLLLTGWCTAAAGAPAQARSGQETAYVRYGTAAGGTYLAQQRGRPGQQYYNLSPEERARIQRQYREWQSLPPEQKDSMRRRMDEWNRMPPQEQERYQQRYQQWQRLSPDERRQLDNNLKRWDSLSPQEQESIRRRFKN
jgi:hypothetical protein